MTVRHPVIEVIDPLMVEVLRQKTPQQRLAIAFNMWESARVMIGGVLRQQHLDWDELYIQRELARRLSHGVVDREGLPHAADGT